jgi:hypothetical protein
VFDHTPDDFRAELERLAREDYVPITTAELAAGRIDIPAGKHPVVLTFDDGDPTTLTLGPDGTPAAGTAVRILLDVAAAHPGFRPVASMYVNADPYGGGEAGYAPSTLALPFGARPRNPELAVQGPGYDYTAALLVGANPAPSPFSEDFTAQAIPRIRSQGPDGLDGLARQARRIPAQPLHLRRQPGRHLFMIASLGCRWSWRQP